MSSESTAAASFSVRTPSHKASRSSRSSKYSGYASSSTSSRSYGQSLQDVYTQWKAADEATQRQGQEKQEADECSQELATARKIVANLRAEQFPANAPKRKKSLFTKGKNESTAHLPMQPVPNGMAEIVEATVTVHELERRFCILTKQVEATKEAAATLDQCFDTLRSTMDNGPLPSRRYTLGNEDFIERAEKSVASREKAYVDSQATTGTFARARLAVQSAHHHYSKAMDLVDSVCNSEQRNGWAAMIGDEQSRETTYKEAVQWAQKAQICFNECVRVLGPHWDLIQRDHLEDCEQLKQAGLLQALRLYELMYGGKSLQLGIVTQQVQLMVRKQTAVFDRLTRFAVGVQSCTVHCETVQQDARVSRDRARRYMISLWMNDDSSNIPSSP